MATFANVGIFDRTWGFGHSKVATESATTYDQNGSPSTTNFTAGDQGSKGVTNRYGAPVFFGSAFTGSVATQDKEGDNITITGAVSNIGVVGDGVFDRVWGFGDQATGYRGNAGAASQSGYFSSGTKNADGTWNSNTSNYTSPRDTDSGATAPKYFEVSPGNGFRPAPAQSANSLLDRSSGWGHTNGAGTTVIINGNSIPWPIPGHNLHD